MHELPTTCRKSTFELLLSKMAIEVAGNQCHILVDLSSFLEVFPLYSRVIRRTLLGKGSICTFQITDVPLEPMMKKKKASVTHCWSSHQECPILHARLWLRDQPQYVQNMKSDLQGNVHIEQI